MSSDDNDVDRQVILESGSEVIVGRDNKAVSVQLVQEIFDELTDVKQSLTDNYTQAFKLDFSDLDVLHSKVLQAISQYNVISQTCSATIFYVKGEKQDLGSFSQFAFQSSTGDSPVESLLYRFNILIVPPRNAVMLEVPKPQTYHIEIKLVSGVGFRKKLESDDFAGIPTSFLRMVGKKPDYMKIEYVDYTVAKAMQSVIGGWFSTLNYSSESKLLRFIQSRSHYLRPLFRFILTIATCSYIYVEIPNLFIDGNNDISILARVVITCFILIYVTMVVATIVAKFIEDAIDSWTPISYIKFNKGDEAEIRRSEASNTQSLWKAVAGLIFTCCLSVFNKFVAGYLLHLVINK